MPPTTQTSRRSKTTGARNRLTRQAEETQVIQATIRANQDLDPYHDHTLQNNDRNQLAIPPDLQIATTWRQLVTDHRRAKLVERLYEAAEYTLDRLLTADSGKDAQGWAISAAVMCDKIRLETGQATSQHVNLNLSGSADRVDGLGGIAARARNAAGLQGGPTPNGIGEAGEGASTGGISEEDAAVGDVPGAVGG